MLSQVLQSSVAVLSVSICSAVSYLSYMAPTTPVDSRACTSQLLSAALISEKSIANTAQSLCRVPYAVGFSG